jgi:hypothetical protein
MCWLCDGNGGELQGCQDCGRLICFDENSGDDIMAPAYVTESGDLFCNVCGLEYDRAEEEESFDDDFGC